jgi:opacity protein-like surface antigen
VGANVEGNRTVNHFQTAYITTANVSLGRKIGMRWILRLHGGGSYSALTQQTMGAPKTRQIVGGGSLGFQAHVHTLIASYDRTAMDTYGFAVGTNTILSGAWNWHRPGSRWSLTANVGQQQTRNTGFTSLSGWQTMAGVSTNLNPHATLSAQYVYFTSAGTYLGTYNNLAIHSVRVTLGWIPQTGAPR